MAEFDQGHSVYIHPPRRKPWHWLRIPLLLFAAFFLAELIFLVWVWPSWSEIRDGKIPESALIASYKKDREKDPKLPPLHWTAFQKHLPKSITKVFIFAEDSRFYEHGGIDYQAIREAAEYNWKHKKLLLGASTISQQTSKNLFLSLARNPLRKWHEFLLTYILEAELTKDQILHAYLNIAEFGKGIYGLEAAARIYFGTSASALSESQAVQLAATLPSPKKNNPASATRAFQKRSQRIASAMRIVNQGGSTELAEKTLLDLRLQQLKDVAEAEKQQEAVLSGEELDAKSRGPDGSSQSDAKPSTSNEEQTEDFNAGQGADEAARNLSPDTAIRAEPLPAPKKDAAEGDEP